MTCVQVRLSKRSYDIIIQPGLLRSAGRHIKQVVDASRCFVVSTPPVWKIYGGRLQRSLKSSGFDVEIILIPDGERSKSADILSRVTTALIQRRAERKTPLICLGGGVIGDLGGFAAATYLRGIPVIQIPTTLIAQVDSSIGGKTGINHPLGKNLIGAFHQPELVLADPKVLQTLPSRQFVSGLAEAVKYGVIRDAGLFGFFERELPSILRQSPRVLADMVMRCARNKISYVEQDEYEQTGLRAHLNFGHTIGHALETLGGYRRHTHGEAVAMGMVAEGLLSKQLGMLRSEDDLARMILVLAGAGLPVRLPAPSVGKMMAIMQRDKKVKNGRVRMVLMEKIGKVRLVTLAERELKKGLAAIWI